MLTSIPEIKPGIIAVSRDCFIIDLSQRRRGAIVSACAENGLAVFLGNFDPETPEEAAELEREKGGGNGA